MKYIISIVIIICSFPTGAMEKQRGKRSATEALVEARELEKIPAVEKSSSEFFPIELLPPEIQDQIFKALTQARGATKRARLDNAAQNIRSFFRTNRLFKSFENDQVLINYIITQLANNYADGDKVAAAVALGTESARKWFAVHHTVPISDAEKKILHDNFKKNFMNAARDSRLNVIDFLLSLFMPPTFWNEVLHDTLIDAIYYNQVAAINKILSHPRFLIRKLTILNAREQALLFSAIRMNKPEIVDLLTRAGANVNQVNSGNETSLHMAARQANPTIVQMLLNAHANPNVANDGGMTALMLAAEGGFIDSVSLLANAVADINQVDIDGHSALWHAQNYAQQNRDAIIKVLMEHEAI